MNLSIVRNNTRLLVCLGLYLASLFGFALLYRDAFASDHNHFLFNIDILKAQESRFKSSTELLVAKQTAQLQAYEQLITDLNQRASPPTPENGNVTFRLPGYSFTFSRPITSFSGSPIEQGPAQPLLVLIHDRDGREIAQEGIPAFSGPFFPANIEFYRDVANTAIDRLKSSISENQRLLATVGSATPEVWGFWDFFYFSVVTQTTVGYGDILPNSTSVRMLVISQIILGLVIATFAINFIFTSKTP